MPRGMWNVSTARAPNRLKCYKGRVRADRQRTCKSVRVGGKKELLRGVGAGARSAWHEEVSEASKGRGGSTEAHPHRRRTVYASFQLPNKSGQSSGRLVCSATATRDAET